MPSPPYSVFLTAAAELKALYPKTAAFTFYEYALLTAPAVPTYAQILRLKGLGRAALGELQNLPKLRKSLQEAVVNAPDPGPRAAVAAALEDCATLPKSRAELSIALGFYGT